VPTEPFFLAVVGETARRNASHPIHDYLDDLPPRTIPLFKLDRTPMEGRADTAGASM